MILENSEINLGDNILKSVDTTVPTTMVGTYLHFQTPSIAQLPSILSNGKLKDARCGYYNILDEKKATNKFEQKTICNALH